MKGNGVVLIVDDHVPLARSLVSLFSVSGFDAQAVHNGAEALAFIRSNAAVALILLDMSDAGYVRRRSAAGHASPEALSPVRRPS